MRDLLGGEHGASPIELALGVLGLLVPVALAVMSFGPLLERQSFARLAAAEASRAVVIADGDGTDALVQLTSMAANHGYDLATVRIGLCGATPVTLSAGGATACPGTLTRGGTVVARVEVSAPLLLLPWNDDSGNPVGIGGTDLVAEHESFVDRYRSIG